ncbi:hypothetical protein [Stutzerimonas nosocomialis]|uniref:hypothetical protein n=1 Tax=Stutzerimonas nosocomialis TaxID=1056496 RepID=UPI001109F087|nr:hypothetical protein [Stutzerimonas nosocomialis]
MKLFIDDRVANRSSDVELECHNYEQAIAALERLNGQEHTLLSIERVDGWQLCVGGGGSDFVVNLSSQCDENFTLLNPDGDGGSMVELCAGGQFSEFSRSIVVDKVEVSKAIYSFFLRKEMELNWERD